MEEQPKKKWFHNLLSKFLFVKEGESIKQDTTEQVQEPKEPEPVSAVPNGEVCDSCGMNIYGEQRVVHKFGKAYHLKPCWRKMFKEAKREMLS